MGEHRLRALIVDDDTIARTLLRGVLRALDVEVLGEATSGRRALALAEQLSPDLVCLDIGLPDGEGSDLVAELRAACPSAQVVMVTGHAEGEQVKRSLAGGARGYIVKPYNGATVRATLARLFPAHTMD